ncbi:hypothetical protein LEP1GSC013_2686 [Leptospira interrogans serovar Valbuzzi str. Duyster]|uniref:hypothetical protein n=1 Tax=Leptospira interrogans TaxID=173 RepID=UPI0002BC519A|nr:hypothetical protein [Leptospira interrogans]EMJ58235.1 hypothetical protein LEP1GSC013_2686 [Leptospira interrogans serovar Valbuzzi str. Duyster]ENO73315.1 hypothetical protein LEP1GSC012_2993 [Leptospira interrogans serovar Valbuzzi str. Valbuzzi]
MKVVEFIKKYEITPVLAAGFLDHLRRVPEEDVKEEILRKVYQEFSGINLDKIKNSTWEQVAVHIEEKIFTKANVRESN